ncbi:MAG: small basic protein [Candidatus Omnitrophica bacterium]|nr:small basic protein [Candidatus Omnitrophota bacterium]
MSIHSSLRSSGSNKHRSVLKRFERLKVLKDKTLWNSEKSVLGLPKVKQQKIKVKKEKAAPAAEAGAAAPAAPASAPKAAAPAAKSDKK